MTARTRLLLAAIVAAGLLLRLASYDDALFGDELSTYFVVHGHGLHQMLGLIHSDQEQTPPLYFFAAWLTAKLGGGAQTLRLPSLLAGLAAIPLVYALGARTVGRRAGLVAAALLAFSPFLIFYSTEARSYALLMLLCLTSTYALVRALESSRLGWWALYAAATCAAMYTHYTGLFLLAGQALWALAAHRESWRPIAGANAAAAAAYIPWLNGYRQDARSPGADVIGLIHPFGVHTAFDDAAHMALGAPYVQLGSVPGPVGLALIGAGVALGTCVALARGRRRPPRAVLLLAVCAGVVPVGAAVASVAGPSVYLSRNLITALPYLALLIGALVVSARRPLGAASAALVLAGAAIGAVLMLDGANQRPDYNAVVDYVRHTGRPGDPIAEIALPFAAPGILQSLEVALHDRGVADHPVIRVGLPTVAADVRRREPPGPGQFAPIPIPSAVALAHRAIAQSRAGTLFVALQTNVPLERLRSLPDNPATRFMATIARDLRPVGARRFPGIAGGVRLFAYRR